MSAVLTSALKQELLDTFASGVKLDEPMASHTTWRVGGPAELLFQPTNETELSSFLRALPSELPLHWVGFGSNLLVRDGGVEGVVISTRTLERTLERKAPHGVYAGASLPCATLARSLVRWEMGPSEFFAGIPGSLGGALTMNAGAHGTETWDAVHDVRLMHRDGSVETRDATQFDVGYRRVSGQGNAWFVGAHLQFDPAYQPSLDRLRELQARRHATQPIGQPSCGSVFANPEGDHSARLIEASGLKGFRIGGAEVSPKHANFIINTGHATAADIESLIDHVAQTVEHKHGVALRHEVRFLGEVAA
ncbi:MAG: UDP-N-acetylmuramate dehydrogenase [Pseudomonadota bacterium]